MSQQSLDPEFDRLAELYDAFRAARWSREKARLHDEIARYVHKHGVVLSRGRYYTPTDDGSFSVTEPPPGVASQYHRQALGRSTELMAESMDTQRGRHGRWRD